MIQEKTITRTLRIVAASTLALGALGLTGCSMLNQFMPSSAPSRDAATGEVTEKQDNADVFAIRVGDCVDTNSAGSQISSLPVVPCGESHSDEAFYAYNVEAGDFPGEDVVNAEGMNKCLPEFEAFVGSSYEESTLDFWPMTPTEGSWAQGDREVVCFVYDTAGDTVGSLKGSGR